LRSHPLPDIVIEDTRTIYLSGEMDEELDTKVVLGLYKLLADGHDNITLLINSEGGNLFIAHSLTDAIADVQRNGITVIGRVQGLAASAAIFPLVACTRRVASPHSVLMVHGLKDSSTGDVRSMKAEAELNTELIRQQSELLGERTLISADQWLPWLEDQLPRYYTAKQALEAGLVDEIQ
jgi:ATP-dependent Clp protease, protease subunit